MTSRDNRLDGIDAQRRGPDFLSQVREVCRLRTDHDRSTSGAEILNGLTTATSTATGAQS